MTERVEIPRLPTVRPTKATIAASNRLWEAHQAERDVIAARYHAALEAHRTRFGVASHSELVKAVRERIQAASQDGAVPSDGDVYQPFSAEVMYLQSRLDLELELHNRTFRAAAPILRESEARLVAGMTLEEIRERFPPVALQVIHLVTGEPTQLLAWSPEHALIDFHGFESGDEELDASVLPPESAAYAALRALCDYVNSGGTERQALWPSLQSDEYWKLARDFAVEAYRWRQVAPTTPLRRRRSRFRLPELLPQPTFPEAKVVAIAYNDGPTLRRWQRDPLQTALVHTLPGAALEVRLEAGLLPMWLGMPATHEALEVEVRSAGLPATKLFCFVLALLVESKDPYVEIDLDELVDVVFDPRSTREREACRVRLWRWLTLYGATRVYGARRGVYTDRATNRRLDTTSRDPLFAVVGEDPSVQQALDASAPPLRLTLAKGAFLKKFDSDRGVLTYFGDLLKVLRIPSGKPSGAMAVCMGLALQQLWREGAVRAAIEHDTDAENTGPKFRPFTRREMFSLFTPDPAPETILAGDHPERAFATYEKAVEQLKRSKIIGLHKELAPLRKGYKRGDEWLDQPLDIRPHRAGAEQVAAIGTSARGRRRSAQP